MQYLYLDGESFVFMDNDNYEQLMISKDVISKNKNYLIAGMNIDILFDGDEVLDVRLPAHVVLMLIVQNQVLKAILQLVHLNLQL